MEKCFLVVKLELGLSCVESKLRRPWLRGNFCKEQLYNLYILGEIKLRSKGFSGLGCFIFFTVPLKRVYLLKICYKDRDIKQRKGMQVESK